MCFSGFVCVFRYFSLYRQHLSCVDFFFLFYLSQFQSHRNSIALILMRADTELCNHPLSLVENWKCKGDVCLVLPLLTLTSSSVCRGLGSCVRGCVKLIKEFLYSNPYIGNTPSLNNISGEERCKTGSKQDLGATILSSKRD